MSLSLRMDENKDRLTSLLIYKLSSLLLMQILELTEIVTDFVIVRIKPSLLKSSRRC